jgi:hypothetical protein
MKSESTLQSQPSDNVNQVEAGKVSPRLVDAVLPGDALAQSPCPGEGLKVCQARRLREARRRSRLVCRSIGQGQDTTLPSLPSPAVECADILCPGHDSHQAEPITSKLVYAHPVSIGMDIYQYSGKSKCMSKAAAIPEQFPLFEVPEMRLPKAVRTVWDEVRDMAKIQQDHGQLVPIGLAAKLLGLSSARVGQLADEGTFRTWDFFGKRYVAVIDLESFIKLERKTGRPWNEPSVKELWKLSYDYARGK